MKVKSSCEEWTELKRHLSRSDRRRISRLARSGMPVHDDSDAAAVRLLLECFSFVPPGMSRRRETLNLLGVVAVVVAIALYFSATRPGALFDVLAVAAFALGMALLLVRSWLLSRYETTQQVNGWGSRPTGQSP